MLAPRYASVLSLTFLLFGACFAVRGQEQPAEQGERSIEPPWIPEGRCYAPLGTERMDNELLRNEDSWAARISNEAELAAFVKRIPDDGVMGTHAQDPIAGAEFDFEREMLLVIARPVATTGEPALLSIVETEERIDVRYALPLGPVEHAYVGLGPYCAAVLPSSDKPIELTRVE